MFTFPCKKPLVNLINFPVAISIRRSTHSKIKFDIAKSVFILLNQGGFFKFYIPFEVEDISAGSLMKFGSSKALRRHDSDQRFLE